MHPWHLRVARSLLLALGLLTGLGSLAAARPSGTPVSQGWEALPAVSAWRRLAVGAAVSGSGEVRPGIGCWFWTTREFEAEGYRPFLDQAARFSNFGLLTTSLRAPVEVTDPAVHDQIRRAAEQARGMGMALVLDLDVRLARAAFRERHPEELQEIVRLREVPLRDDGVVELRIECVGGGDHYTFRAPPYHPVASRLLRVFGYRRGPDGIRSDTVEDRTAVCEVVQADDRAVVVRIPCEPGDGGRTAAVLAVHSLFTPDVFAPHLVAFERGILEQYADVPLAGACKDEWGFPGGMANATNLWYSRAMAGEYVRRRPGHSLERDLLLMGLGEAGREGERVAAIHHYMEMIWQRNAEVETAFRDGIRAVFGPGALAATHPTWFPFPDAHEVFKNGLDWWAVPRELAQTDEATPFAARTALAKRCGSPLWFNMYYDNQPRAYEEDVWRHALGGGRMNFHPLYPGPWEGDPWALARSPVLQASARIGLLDFITTAPVDCPVAVVFGHAAALDWAGPSFAQVGLGITDALWELGHYADLIPTSEIAAGRLTLGPDGKIAYGAQPYAVVILHHPQSERATTGAFFRKALEAGGTTLLQVGDRTLGFEGEPAGVGEGWPGVRRVGEAEAVREATARLDALGIRPQTPGARHTVAGFPGSVMPIGSGACRFLDGTRVVASGRTQVLGDPIRGVLDPGPGELRYDAVGVLGVRLDGAREIQALAAGGLRLFVGGGLRLELAEPVDLALWRDSQGQWQGVVLGLNGPVPEPLARLTSRWTRLRWPERRQP